MNKTLDMIMESRIVAIIRGVSSERIVPAVGALKDGGITCVEVTFSAKSEEESRDTLKAISLLKKEFGDAIALGAGTVLTVQNVRDAAEAGATYMISPNTDEAVIGETKKLGLVSIPGAMTPTEIITAWNYGADIVKLFPAATLGLDYIKAIRGPITHIPMTAVGGVNAGNAQSFLDAGCVGVSVGGNLASNKLIEAGDYQAITRLALEYKLK